MPTVGNASGVHVMRTYKRHYRQLVRWTGSVLKQIAELDSKYNDDLSVAPNGAVRAPLRRYLRYAVRPMDTELVRMQADELAWLAARLNRRTADMDAMEPNSQDFRDAVLVSDVLAQEITAAVRKLLVSIA